MQLFHSPASPFVRKCLVCAHELGLRGRLQLVTAAPHPVNRDRNLIGHNPLGKIPTLITDEQTVLYDSRVICEYLNSLGDGHLLPRDGAARWQVLVEQSLADGLLDAAVLTRYETAVRPEALRWESWTAGQMDKVDCALAALEASADAASARVDLGAISVACALGYLDFRYGSLGWRSRHPRLAAWFARFGERESMRATRPPP